VELQDNKTEKYAYLLIFIIPQMKKVKKYLEKDLLLKNISRE